RGSRRAARRWSWVRPTSASSGCGSPRRCRSGTAAAGSPTPTAPPASRRSSARRAVGSTTRGRRRPGGAGGTPTPAPPATPLPPPGNPAPPPRRHAGGAGWMEAAFNLAASPLVAPAPPLALRYRLLIHAGAADPDLIHRAWDEFAATPAYRAVPARGPELPTIR